MCSLYPYVQKWRAYPVGHPTVLNGDALIGLEITKENVEDYFGLLNVQVLVPKDCLQPVLPYRLSSGLLVFGNCRSCMDELNNGDCTHAEVERCITGISQ